MIERRDHPPQPESPVPVNSHSENPLAGLTLPNRDLLSQVMQGDCFQLLPTLPPHCIDCIFVDAPYNIGIDYGCGSQADRLPSAEYLWQMEKLIGLCVEQLTPTGSLWFLCPERWADEIGGLLTSHLPRRNRIIWRETFGQYRDSSFPSGHRHLFYHVMDPDHTPFFTEDIRVPSQRMLVGDKRAAGLRVPDDVWEIPRLVGSAAERIPEHPCQLPERLLERVILCSTQPGNIVLDPTAGTGTTLRVAQQLGRRYLGIEKEAPFVDLIKKRLAKERQGDLFLH